MKKINLTFIILLIFNFCHSQKENLKDCKLNKVSDNFNFKLVTTVKTVNDVESSKVAIQISDKKNNQLQEIKYSPQYIMSHDKTFCNAISYFNSSKNIDEGLEEYHTFIVMDFNFDGLEDFAILDYEGSNSGPQYTYFLQDKNTKFLKNKFLTESIRFFPSEFNLKNKSFTQSNPVGCCKINTVIYKFVNNKWKILSSKQQEMK
jgi:hypothetical protein